MQDIFGNDVNEIVEEDIQRKKYSLFGDFVPDLTIEKKNLLRLDDQAHKDYTPYMLAKFFSMGQGGIFYANEVNRLPNMSKQMSYDFFIHAIRKGKQYNPWAKGEKQEENVAMLMQYFQVNEQVAESYMKCISDEELEAIKEDTKIGGRQ